MIKINDSARAFVGYTIGLTKEEEKGLAGDIENWLLTRKNIKCEVKVI